MSLGSVAIRTTALLETDNLSVGYRTGSGLNILFEKLNLQIQPGSLICFMGPNGIGKSTLIRTLAGLQVPLSGTFKIKDPINQSTGSKNVALVLTDRITAMNMTVRDLVNFGRYPYMEWNLKLSGDDKMAIEKAISLTHISDLIEKRLYELSDGQMQLVMITRALAQDTSLLLLDEPTAHLDLNNRVEIMNLLRTLARNEGKGILIATHELDLALQTSDKIWLTGSNKNILTGIPEDLVLNGSFDDIFQFKGFDLKSGKVFHEPWRNISVHIEGSGHDYLWTKNAFERDGFKVTDESETHIKIIKEGHGIYWSLNHQPYSNLQSLLEHLILGS